LALKNTVNIDSAFSACDRLHTAVSCPLEDTNICGMLCEGVRHVQSESVFCVGRVNGLELMGLTCDDLGF
jgi:hypothetical protein